MNVDETEFAKFFGEDLRELALAFRARDDARLRVALRCAGDVAQESCEEILLLGGERVVGERGGGVDGGVGRHDWSFGKIRDSAHA